MAIMTGTTNTFGSIRAMLKQTYPDHGNYAPVPKESQNPKFKNVSRIMRGHKKGCECKDCK